MKLMFFCLAALLICSASVYSTTLTVCDGGTVSLGPCDLGGWIEINSTEWHRKVGATNGCVGTCAATCGTLAEFEARVREECHGKNYCSFTANRAFFAINGNPDNTCPCVTKYLDLTYMCVCPSNGNVTTTGTPTSEDVPTTGTPTPTPTTATQTTAPTTSVPC